MSISALRETYSVFTAVRQAGYPSTVDSPEYILIGGRGYPGILAAKKSSHKNHQVHQLLGGAVIQKGPSLHGSEWLVADQISI